MQHLPGVLLLVLPLLIQETFPYTMMTKTSIQLLKVPVNFLEDGGYLPLTIANILLQGILLQEPISVSIRSSMTLQEYFGFQPYDPRYQLRHNDSGVADGLSGLQYTSL